jgi:Mn2+/Fe2+ NRAMP family transporter
MNVPLATRRGNLLTFGLPFALVPLPVFTARRSVTGTFVNRTVTTAMAAQPPASSSH